MDVRKGRISPVGNFLDFGFYLTFFPQLVAGPIVRASDFIDQLHRHPVISVRTDLFASLATLAVEQTIFLHIDQRNTYMQVRIRQICFYPEKLG